MQPIGLFPRTCSRVANALSGEWMLGHLRSNGGTVILMRTIFITIWVVCGAIGLIALCDPDRPGPMTWAGFWSQLEEIGGWIGPIFGGVYLALYARFSAQWTYIANLYNMIMQARANGGAYDDVRATWAAAFIEDADNLHLAMKSSVAPIIRAWKDDKDVQRCFVEHTPGGQDRWDYLMASVETVFQNESRLQMRRCSRLREKYCSQESNWPSAAE